MNHKTTTKQTKSKLEPLAPTARVTRIGLGMSRTEAKKFIPSFYHAYIPFNDVEEIEVRIVIKDKRRNVRAGIAHEDLIRVMPATRIISRLERYNNNELVVFHVTGDCLEGFGIFDGDIAVTLLTQDIKNGDFVIAQPFDSSVPLIKRFYRDKHNYIRLDAHNPNYPPITYKAHKVKIIGRVVRIERDIERSSND